MFLPRCIFFKGRFYTAEHWKGWLQPRDSPQGGPNSHLQLFPPCYGSFGGCGGGGVPSAPLSVCAKRSGLHPSGQWYAHNACAQLPGFGFALEHRGLCVHPPITWRSLHLHLPIASVLRLSKGAVNLRVKLLSQHTWQACSFRWNPVKIKHLSNPEAGP